MNNTPPHPPLPPSGLAGISFSCYVGKNVYLCKLKGVYYGHNGMYNKSNHKSTTSYTFTIARCTRRDD